MRFSLKSLNKGFFSFLKIKSAMRKFYFFLFFLCLALSGGSIGARAEETISQVIRALIDGQITAFRTDDGEKAYSYAAPAVRDLFTNSESFMAMVRNGYQPLYRPQSVTYGRLRESRGSYVQEVFVTGPDGEPYIALYTFERQKDGSWKISGCWLEKIPARDI